MKRIRCILTSIFLLLLMAFGQIPANALNTGFSTESLEQDDINTLLKNTNISVLTEEPSKKPIDCFDVDEDGLVAIGCSNHEKKTICVYTNDGTFLYGYTFKSNGDFGIEIRKSLLNIYLVRSDVSITLNPKGEVESILKIQNTSENNAYWNNYVFLSKRKIGDTEYALENDMGFLNFFASSYSQIVITNEKGERSIIYDVNDEHLFNMAFLFIGCGAFVCTVIILVFREFLKLRR